MAETTTADLEDTGHVGDREITRHSADTLSSPEMEIELQSSVEVQRAVIREQTGSDGQDIVSIKDDESDRAGSSNAGDLAENGVLTITEDKQGQVTPEGSQSPSSLQFQSEDIQVTSSGTNSVTNLTQQDLQESECNSSIIELQTTIYENDSRKTQLSDFVITTVEKQLSVTEYETENQKSKVEYMESTEQTSFNNNDANDKQSKIKDSEPSLHNFKETQPEQAQSTVDQTEPTTQQVTVRDYEVEIQQISQEITSDGQRHAEIGSEGGVVHISTRQEVLQVQIQFLQKRLETLIQENNQKNLKIIQLQEDLLSLTQQLRTAETKSKSSDTLPYRLETPRSKTCDIL